MNTGTLIYMITMGWALIIHGGITYLFWKKKDYTLLSGFSNRTEEEKNYLIKNGYLDAIGKLFATTFWLFFATFIFGLLPIPWAFEISISLFIFILMVGIVWIQRYEVPHKRKKMFWITGIISFATIAFITIITGIGYIDNEFNVHDEKFEITGMYGIEWNLADIETVELLDELPEIKFKTNGFATSGMLKGHFTLEDPYGKGILFINEKSPPYLFVATREEYVIISDKSPAKTKEVFEKIRYQTKAQAPNQA